MPRLRTPGRADRHRTLSLSAIALGFTIAFLSLWVRMERAPGGRSVSLPTPGAALNSHVLARVRLYPAGGSVTMVPRQRQANSMGVTRDIFYLGEKFWEGDPEHAHCSGLIFEVYLGACEDWSRETTGSARFSLPGVDLNSFRALQRAFYGTDGNERTLVDALVSRGLGIEVLDPEDARPGDLVQFWRLDGTGHSVVFLDWIRDGAQQINGLRFWSIQGGGIGEATGLIAYDHETTGIDRHRIYIVRALPPG